MTVSATDERIGQHGGYERRETAEGASWRRVTLVISSLSAGGAERVMSLMANYWAERGWNVTLVTLDDASTDFHPIDRRVARVALGLSVPARSPWEAARNNVRRLVRLRDAIKASEPRAVIAFTAPTTVLTIMACHRLGVPVIVSERNPPTEEQASPWWDGLRRHVYPSATALVVQTPEVVEWAKSLIALTRVHVIPNPVLAVPDAILCGSARTAARCGAVPAREERRPGHRRVAVAMGRLHHQKGFDLLLRAFARSGADRAEWSLRIIGEGAERQRLQAIAAELGIAASVEFVGKVRAPFEVLREADLFVLSSRYEGFPNALLEAMAVGLPVIATDCPFGPKHIVRDGIDGMLVPVENVDAMAAALARLMGDDARRKALGARGVEVRERFALAGVMSQWEQVMNAVATPRSGV